MPQVWDSTTSVGPEYSGKLISLYTIVATMRGSNTDLPKTVDVEELTIRETDWGGMHVNFTTCHKTLDIAPLLRGLPNEMCQCPHWGMVLKGRKLVKYADRE
jgi:hypothetical protein